MRFATWNVNSLRARQERVEEWLAEVQPDVVMLQETKLADDAFPTLSFGALGYESAHYGQGQWNGVAILSKVGIDDVVVNFADGIEPDPDARIITATCGGVRVTQRLRAERPRRSTTRTTRTSSSWLDRLARPPRRRHGIRASRCSSAATSTSPRTIATCTTRRSSSGRRTSASRSAIASPRSSDWGLSDVFRAAHPEDRVYSWWDYRAGDFHQGRGLRIDLLMCSASVAERATWCVIDRNARKGKSPSDHAPVIVDLDS